MLAGVNGGLNRGVCYILSSLDADGADLNVAGIGFLRHE